MTEEPDPLSRLRGANPLPAERASSAGSPHAKALLERIVATPPEQPEPRKRRISRRSMLILVPAVILALGAAGYGLYKAVATDPLVVACYRQMSTVTDVSAAAASERDPVTTCRTLWLPGGEFNRDGHLPVPPLAACVKNGAIAVYPHPRAVDPCEALGLPHPAQTTLSDETRAVLRVEEDLAVAFTDSCVGQDRAVALANAELRKWGLERWHVIVQRPFTTSLPCAGAGYDPPSRTVILSPVENTP
jgi:hypothetical protein